MAFLWHWELFPWIRFGIFGLAVVGLLISRRLFRLLEWLGQQSQPLILVASWNGIFTYPRYVCHCLQYFFDTSYIVWHVAVTKCIEYCNFVISLLFRICINSLLCFLYQPSDAFSTTDIICNKILYWTFSSFTYCIHIVLDFDSTLGFPGEGPAAKWSCCTANVDAVQTHPDCLEWDFAVTVLQETRINQSVYNQVSFELGKKSKSLVHGGLLIPKKTKANTFVTPHGGVAILSNQATTRAFCSDDDSTGLWPDIATTTRVAAAWIQVLPKVRALVFSFYGEVSRHDNSHLKINDFLLENIFVIAAQFGDIPITSLWWLSKLTPILIAAVSSAKQHGNWIDPLTKHDHQGNSTRPITYSRNAVFWNPTDYFSSIDSILVNRTASFALTSVDVDYSRAKHMHLLLLNLHGRRFTSKVPNWISLHHFAWRIYPRMRRMNSTLTWFPPMPKTYGIVSLNNFVLRVMITLIGIISTCLLLKLWLTVEQNLRKDKPPGSASLLSPLLFRVQVRQ